MKTFTAVISLMLALTLAFAPVAEAKRLGGKSFGRSYKTAPAPVKKTPPPSGFKDSNSASSQQSKSTTTQPAQKPGVKPQSSRWGMFGGVLAGLAAGGLLASLFGSGAFSGIQGFDILILLLLAGAVFFLLRRFRAQGGQRAFQPQTQPQTQVGPFSRYLSAAADNHNDHNNNQTNHSAGSFGVPLAEADIPMNLPGGFNKDAFLAGACDHYRRIQQAWNSHDLPTLKEYLAADLYQQLADERNQLQGEQHTEVLHLDASLVRADYNARLAQVSVHYSGRYQDPVEGVEEAINDIWHLERDITRNDAPWHIVGIESF